MAYIIQIIIQLPLRLFYKLYYRFEARGVENLDGLRDPILFISNHITLHDPWLAASSLRFGSRFLKVHPIGGSKFNPPLKWLYDIGVIPFIYWLFGVVSIPKEGTREEKIQPIVEMLKTGQSVIIYPEGGRTMEHRGIREFKAGTAEVFLRTKVQIVPIGIRRLDPPKRGICLTFGKSFMPTSNNVDNITRELYAKVLKLVQ